VPLTHTHTVVSLTYTQEAGVAQALVVQPINYGFDHSYLLNEVHARHGGSMRLMALADPSRGPEQLDDFPPGSIAGVRFNPYLQAGWMASEACLALFRRAGDLGLPVGVMCFQVRFRDFLGTSVFKP
jgi:hypothetical protein